jgi:hypothetical protein
MMPLDPQQRLCLIDSQSRCFGDVSITRIEGDRVFAKFTARADFSAVSPVFDELEQAANDQMFTLAGELSKKIDVLGLRLTSADGGEQLELCDVQIMNGSDLCCRVPNLALMQTPQTTVKVA